MSAKTTQPDTLPLMQAGYMYPHFKVGHGPLMAKYCLYGDGTVFKGEVDKYQFGLWSQKGHSGRIQKCKLLPMSRTRS